MKSPRLMSVRAAARDRHPATLERRRKDKGALATERPLSDAAISTATCAGAPNERERSPILSLSIGLVDDAEVDIRAVHSGSLGAS